MPWFLVGESERMLKDAYHDHRLVVVEAADADAAKQLAVLKFFAPRDHALRKDILGRGPDSVLTRALLFRGPEDLTTYYKQDRKPSVSGSEFADRVKTFFGEYREFAEAYFYYVVGDETSLEIPDDILAYLWVHLPGWASVTVVPLGFLPSFRA